MSYPTLINLSNLSNEDYKINKPLAIFDLDHTLIKPKSNKKIVTDKDDWTFLNDNLPEIIKKLNKTYHIIIVTNQKILSKSNSNKSNWIEKINNIIKILSIKIEIFASLKDDFYRKPCIGIFNIIKQKYTFNIHSSFFCGDAAGRKNDFSDCDLKFAMNCGLHFILPEKIFKIELYDKNINFSYVKLPTKYIKTLYFKSKEKEMLIFVGFPASGKSSISRQIQRKNPSYKIINRDTLKTIKKCEKVTEEEIKKGYSIIIDNTNPHIESRNIFIKIAKKYNYSIRCIEIDCSKELALHNNSYRNYKYNINKIPEIAYNVFIKRYQKPTLDEGFDEIIKLEPYKPKDLDYLLFYF
jgi:bifunctional polynucleotide phosphatase/kinase